MGIPQVSSTNTNGFKAGKRQVSLYIHRFRGVVVSCYTKWISFSEDGFELWFADNFTVETEGGKGSSRGNLLPSKRDCPSGIGTRPTPAKRDDTRAGRPIPSEHQGFGQVDPLVYRKWASTSSSRRGFVIRSSCLRPSSVVYSREKPTHTSNCGVVSASWAGTRR